MQFQKKSVWYRQMNTLFFIFFLQSVLIKRNTELKKETAIAQPFILFSEQFIPWSKSVEQHCLNFFYS